MRILQRAPQSYPRSACPVPAQRIAHHFPRHRALRLHRESASGCRAAEDFGERHEFAVLDDATRTTAREQSAEVRGLQLYPISRTGQRARGERRSNGRKDVWLGCFSAVGTLTGVCRISNVPRDHVHYRARVGPHAGVCRYARIFLAPTQSLTKVRTSVYAVRASQNERSRSDGYHPMRATSLPCVCDTTLSHSLTPFSFSSLESRRFGT